MNDSAVDDATMKKCIQPLTPAEATQREAASIYRMARETYEHALEVWWRRGVEVPEAIWASVAEAQRRAAVLSWCARFQAGAAGVEDPIEAIELWWLLPRSSRPAT